MDAEEVSPPPSGQRGRKCGHLFFGFIDGRPASELDLSRIFTKRCVMNQGGMLGAVQGPVRIRWENRAGDQNHRTHRNERNFMTTACLTHLLWRLRVSIADWYETIELFEKKPGWLPVFLPGLQLSKRADGSRLGMSNAMSAAPPANEPGQRGDKSALSGREFVSRNLGAQRRGFIPTVGGSHAGVPTMSCITAKDCGVPTILQLYLQEIKDDSLLTAAEECSLAEAIARGDGEARRGDSGQPAAGGEDRAGLLGRGIVLDDLIGEGNLGLIRAAEEFDPRFGTRFSTYAATGSSKRSATP